MSTMSDDYICLLEEYKSDLLSGQKSIDVYSRCRYRRRDDDRMKGHEHHELPTPATIIPDMDYMVEFKFYGFSSVAPFTSDWFDRSKCPEVKSATFKIENGEFMLPNFNFEKTVSVVPDWFTIQLYINDALDFTALFGSLEKRLYNKDITEISYLKDNPDLFYNDRIFKCETKYFANIVERLDCFQSIGVNLEFLYPHTIRYFLKHCHNAHTLEFVDDYGISRFENHTKRVLEVLCSEEYRNNVNLRNVLFDRELFIPDESKIEVLNAILANPNVTNIRIALDDDSPVRTEFMRILSEHHPNVSVTTEAEIEKDEDYEIINGGGGWDEVERRSMEAEGVHGEPKDAEDEEELEIGNLGDKENQEILTPKISFEEYLAVTMLDVSNFDADKWWQEYLEKHGGKIE